MRRAFIVEAIALPGKTYLVDTGRQLRESSRGGSRRRAPGGVVAGSRRILRERVQDVGEQKLLMLLLVMQADLEDADHLRKIGLSCGGEQALDRRVDMGPERGHVVAIRARDQSALRASVARAGGDIIGVEEISEPLIEDAIAGQARTQQELLQEPGGMRAMPLGRTGIGHRLHHLVLGGERCCAAFGFRANDAEGVPPADARIVGRGGRDRCGVIFLATATKDE